jgi:hypothetical protein
VSRHPLLLVPALLAAIALPVAPAFAGEDDDDGSAQLHASSQDCVVGKRAKAAVSGDSIDNVAFYVDGKLIRRVTRAGSSGSYRFAMRCTRLRVGAHRARAVVTFEDSSPQTLRFQITRARQASPRFTG